MKKLVLPFAFTVALAVLLASHAFAQGQTLILGNDTTTTDAGIVRRVAVDAQGRLLTSGGASTDGGVTVIVPYCTVTASKNTTVGTSSTAVPATPLAGRWLIRVCNSARNAGTPILTCTSDATVPTVASTSPGDTLEAGDCAQYTTGSGILCISDTASTAVTSEECR